MQEPRTINLSVGPQEEQLALQIKNDVDRGLTYLQERKADAAILAFKLALQKCHRDSPVHDVVTHNLLTAYRQRIEEILRQPDVTPANRYIPEVSALQLQGPLAGNSEFIGKFADTFKSLGMDFYNARQYEAALFFIRKAIAIQPCPSYYVDLTNALAFTRQPVRLRDYTTAYVEKDLGRHIFIACAPKSGSTFLKNVLVNVTGFKELFSVYAALQNEHDIDLPQLAKFGAVDTVTQQHSRASEANIQLLQAFAIKPVILVRNIFDSVISLLDFYTQGFTFSTFFPRDEFLSLDQEQRIDLLIEYVIPWYFQFVASWQRAEREQRLEVCWLTYEEMIADKPKAVEGILGFYALSYPRAVIQQQIAAVEAEAEKNRYNKGVAGRGQTGLSAEQKQRITRLARHFPSADFERIGL